MPSWQTDLSRIPNDVQREHPVSGKMHKGKKKQGGAGKFSGDDHQPGVPCKLQDLRCMTAAVNNYYGVELRQRQVANGMRSRGKTVLGAARQRV